MTTATQACIDTFSDPFKDYHIEQTPTGVVYKDASGQVLSSEQVEEIKAEHKQQKQQCKALGYQSAFVLGNSGFLIQEILSDVNAYSVEADGYTNVPVVDLPKPSLNVLRAYPGNPKMHEAGAIAELSRYSYQSIMGLYKLGNPPEFYSQEMTDLTMLMGNKVTTPLQRRWVASQAMGSPFLTYEGDNNLDNVLKWSYAVPSYLSLLAGATQLQNGSNDILNVPECDETNELACEALEEAAEEASGNATDLFQESTNESSTASSSAASEYDVSELQGANNVLDLTGQSLTTASIASNALVYASATKRNGHLSVVGGLGALSTLPLGYLVAKKTNHNTNRAADIVSTENMVVSGAAVALGTGAAAVTNDPLLLKTYDANFSALSAAYYSPRASALIDTINLDDGNSELSHMMDTGIPLLNASMFATGGMRLGMGYRNWSEYNTAERVSLVALPLLVAGTHTISTASAADRSNQDGVWVDYGLNMGSYAVGAGLGALLENTGVGRALDGVSVGVSSDGASIRFEGRF